MHSGPQCPLQVDFSSGSRGYSNMYSTFLCTRHWIIQSSSFNTYIGKCSHSWMAACALAFH